MVPASGNGKHERVILDDDDEVSSDEDKPLQKGYGGFLALEGRVGLPSLRLMRQS
jgi:hypothetical protein